MRVQMSGCVLVSALLAGCQTTQPAAMPPPPQPQILMPVGSSSSAPSTVRDSSPAPSVATTPRESTPAPSAPDLNLDDGGGGGGGWG